MKYVTHLVLGVMYLIGLLVLRPTPQVAAEPTVDPLNWYTATMQADTSGTNFYNYGVRPSIAVHPLSEKGKRHTTTLADLPPAAQSLVSAALGRDDATYQFQATADGYRAANASDTVRADFSNAGMRLTSESAQWTLALHSIGYGDALQAVSQVAPIASANRLEYAHATFTEWYVNGPAGLEQGWTLNAPPTSRNGEALTLALALEGKARISASGQAVELLRGDGTTAVRYTGLVAYDATGRDLRAWMELGDHPGSPLRIRVDDTGAQYPLTIDPYLLRATLTYSSGAISDQLGRSVAISTDGSTIVVGAPQVNSSRGAAYVFVRSGSWATTSTPTAKLTNYFGTLGSRLGDSVAINADGSTIVVGAWGASSSKGAAHVFVRQGNNWVDSDTPTATLTNVPSGIANDQLGASVAISADGVVVVVGAPGVTSFTGAAYVFLRAGNWMDDTAPDATLTNSSGSTNDAMGSSVAISADGATVVVGAPSANSDKGAAYVFGKPGGGWFGVIDSTPDATLTYSGGAAGDSLGSSVAISADGLTIVAGAYGVNGAVADTGAAYVFVKPLLFGWGDTGTPNATLTNSNGTTQNYLGRSVAINADGSIIVVGANGVNTQQGAVYVFIKPGGSWLSDGSPDVTLTNPSGAAYDQLGYSVASNGNGLAIVAGAYGGNGNKGAAYVFQQWKVYLPLMYASCQMV